MTRLAVRIERAWRNAVVYPVLRRVIHNPPVAIPLDITGIDSILILRYDKIGDMVVTLPIFRILKRRNPGVRIGVLASEANVDIIRGNKELDDIYVVWRNPFQFLRELGRIRKAHYDVVLNFIFNRMTSGGLISNFVCRDAVRIGLGQEKYKFYFNALLSIPRGAMHMVEMLVRYVEEVFGIAIGEEEKRINLDIEATAIARVDSFLQEQQLKRRSLSQSNGSGFVVFNVSARQQNKRLSFQQSVRIASFIGEELRRRIVVVSAPEDRTVAEEVVSATQSVNCVLFPSRGEASLKEIASLIAGALFVVTPDTAIIHLASAVGTAVIGIFTPLQVNEEWSPYKVPCELIRAPENEPVSSLSPETIVDGIKRFTDRLSVEKATPQTL